MSCAKAKSSVKINKIGKVSFKYVEYEEQIYFIYKLISVSIYGCFGYNVLNKTNIKISNKKSQDKTSIVNVIGLDNAQAQLELLQTQAVSHLEPFGFKVGIFEELAEFIVIRER